MKYSADKPISFPVDDRLGRESFSKLLGEAICNYQGNESIVIGLYGEWGSGKSSIINMTLQNVEHSYSNPVVLRFAPWNYIDKDNLIGCFFSELQALIKQDSNYKFRKIVGKALKDYADVIDVAAYIPVVGFAVAPTLKSLAKIAGDRLSNAPDLNTAKSKLSHALIRYNRKIVVVIDDIDRLNKSQIQDVFQLVKQVGDLPNIVYVLAMDRKIVASALSEVQNIDGNEYLKKIVQIPFEIPAASDSQLYSYFNSEVNAVINEIFPEKTINYDLLYRIYSYCVSPYIHTLRDINRVVNVLKFRISLLSILVVEDLIGITAIEVLNPELYIWIRTNKKHVCNTKIEDVEQKSPNENRAVFEAGFKEIGMDPMLSCYSISILFPRFGNLIGLNPRQEYLDSNPNSGIEISTENGFDNCFSFNLDVNTVDSDELNNCAYIFEENEIRKFVYDIIKRKLFGYFANDFKFIMAGVPYQRLCLIASITIDLTSELEDYEDEDQSQYAFTLKSAVTFICEIIHQFKTSQEVVEFIKKIIESSSASSFCFFSHVLKSIFIDYFNALPRLPFSVRYEVRKRIRDLYVNKAKNVLQNVDVLELRNYLIVYTVWKSLDALSYADYFKNAFSNDVNKLKLLCLFVKESETYISLRYSDCSDCFSYEDICSLLNRFDPQTISLFNDKEKIYIVGLYMENKAQRLSRKKDKEKLQYIKKRAVNILNSWLIAQTR